MLVHVTICGKCVLMNHQSSCTTSHKQPDHIRPHFCNLVISAPAKMVKQPEVTVEDSRAAFTVSIVW